MNTYQLACRMFGNIKSAEKYEEMIEPCTIFCCPKTKGIIEQREKIAIELPQKTHLSSIKL